MNPLSFPPLLLAALLLASCASFERDWKQSVADYEAGKTAAPAGPWAGTWTTATNGHTGNLRAIVAPSPRTPGVYDFRYHATWKRILSGTFPVSFPVTKRGGAHRVDGERKLGLFGTFRHRATITESSFEASYSNEKGDLGRFAMQRP